MGGAQFSGDIHVVSTYQQGTMSSLDVLMTIRRPRFIITDSTPVLHVIYIHDFSIPLRRLDTYTPAAPLRLTGFMGSPSTADTELVYWGPTLIATYDLPS